MDLNVASRPLAMLVACLFVMSASGACRADKGATSGDGAKSAPAAAPKARTAAARALEEAEAEGDLSYVVKGDNAGLGAAKAPKGKDWKGWQYAGDRGACFYQAGRACADSLEEACRLARCAADETCKASGEAPVRVACGAK